MITHNKMLLALAAAAGLTLAGYAARAASDAPNDEAPARAALAEAAFRPTRTQLETLRIEPAALAAFRSEQVTDGMISTNENTTVNVFSPYTGRVVRVQAKVGDLVRKGEPLMSVEASEFVQGQNDLMTAKAALATAQAQLRQAEKTESRQQQLYEAKAGALKDWQQAQADLETARNAVRTAEVVLSASRNRLSILGRSPAEIARLEAQAAGQKLEPEAAVPAPISGTVVQRQVGPGQFIQSASGGAANPVFSIADLSTVWLVANLREADVGLVRVGQAVEVRVLAYPGRVFKARVSFVSPSVDPNTRRVPVRAEISNADGALKPNMAATFTIVTGESSQAVAVPQSAVIYEGTAARVFVVAEDGSLQARDVQVGRQSGPLIEVTSGLAAGQRVVTGGALFIDRAAKGSRA